MSEPTAADRQWGRILLLVGGLVLCLLLGVVIGLQLARVL